MKEMRLDAVIFDLDGTLVDSTPDIARAANAALAPLGIKATDAEVCSWLGNGAQALIEKALSDYQRPLDPERVSALTRQFVAAYEARPVKDTTPFPGALDALAELHARGVRMGVCTNKPETVARRVLDATGIADYVQSLIGGGRYPLKPDPAGLLGCMAELEVETEQTVYIGDQAVDITTARNAGVSVIAAAFGYAGTSASELGADTVLPGWWDLTRVLFLLNR